MALDTALTQGVSTQIDVGAGNLKNNTPQTGYCRVERDSDGYQALIEYDSHDGDRYFEIVGTAPFAAGIGNTVMRAPVDKEMTAAGAASYTAVYTAPPTQMVLKVQNGYTAVKNGPIKPFIAKPIFGASGFSVGAVRTSDA